MLTRRSFLGRASLLAASTLGFPHIVRSATTPVYNRGQKPRHIIHLVSDGMSWGTLTSADFYSQRTRQRGLSWLKVYASPSAHHALMETRSLNSLVTDSAAASSAWGSGSRVPNGVLNVLPDGRLLEPLFEVFGAKGWKRGLVSTAEITHATPAGFAVAVRTRENAQDIALQYLKNRVDILLGGGRPFFEAGKRKDKRDVFRDFTAAGYTVVRNSKDLAAAPLDTRLLGTFASSHLPYTLDHLRDARQRNTVPTLAQLTRAALERLERNSHFILQVEGARIDHAAHNSDAAAAVVDQIAFDEALDVCLEFQKRHGDTLLVMTTDHANSNLGLNGMGTSYRTSSQRFSALAEMKASLPIILTRIQRAGKKVRIPTFVQDEEDRLDVPDPMPASTPPPTTEEEGEDSATTTTAGTTSKPKLTDAYHVEPKRIIEIVADSTGYKMSERRAVLFSKVMSGEYRALYDQMNSPITQLGQLLANHTGVGWTGNTHTSDYCPILALGPGAENFTGFVKNTDVFQIYTKLAGIKFKNPTLPYIADTATSQKVENVAAYTREEEFPAV